MKYLLLLSLIGCSNKSISLVPGSSTARLQTVTQQFETDFKVDVNFEVVFVDSFSIGQSGDVDGYCIRDNAFRRVEILKQFETDDKLNVIVYHELGHCALNLAHYPDTDIMDAYLMNVTVWNFEYFRQQMIDNYVNGKYTLY